MGQNPESRTTDVRSCRASQPDANRRGPIRTDCVRHERPNTYPNTSLFRVGGYSYFSSSAWLIEMVTGLSIPVPYWQFLLWEIALLAVLVCLGIAILYSGAFDPRPVIRTTVVYGLLMFVLTVLFAGVETLVEGLAAPLIGLSEGIGGWMASAAVALSFGPLYAWISRQVKKFAPRSGDGEAEPAVTDRAQ